MKHSRTQDTDAPVIRALRAYRALQRRWWSIEELAEFLDRDLKTARRLVLAIRKAGIRLRVQVQDHGRKRYRAG